VADYRLESPFSGKIPSGGQLNLNFVPTEKVIRQGERKFSRFRDGDFQVSGGSQSGGVTGNRP
jgi:hypothetical protein